MKKPSIPILHTLIIAVATLSVAALSITTFYLSVFDVADPGMLTDTDSNELQTAFIHADLIIIAATALVVLLASVIYFRITQPWAQQAKTFHILAKTAHEAIFLIDVNGVIQFVNPAAEALFGYEKKELLGKSIDLLMPEPHKGMHKRYLDNYLRTGRSKVVGKGQQLLGQRKDGSQFPMYLSVGEVKLDHVHLFAGLIMDLSMQQMLQREILAIPAREQRRIGEELHDGVGQQLTGLSMLAQSLLNHASDSEHELAEQLASGLHESLAQVRALARGLMPVQIYADGFMISLKEITESVSKQSNIPINLQIDDTVLLFDDATANHLYRIVQESLNNAVKHANASHIDVILKVEDGHGMLEIYDDGIGIPSDLTDSSGLGLSIMRHRCGLFDGEITINPAGESGTKVICRFPITAEEAVDDRNPDR